MPLAKSLAELHGGRLLLTSERGVGATIVELLSGVKRHVEATRGNELATLDCLCRTFG